MTRGRDQVYLFHGESPSEFIAILGDTVLHREEPLLKPYPRAEQPAPTPKNSVPPPAFRSLVKPVDFDWDENCEVWFNTDELDAIKRYFARHVYRDNLTFHEWMKPRALKGLQRNLFSQVKHVSHKTVAKIFRKLQEKGVMQ